MLFITFTTMNSTVELDHSPKCFISEDRTHCLNVVTFVTQPLGLERQRLDSLFLPREVMTQ